MVLLPECIGKLTCLIHLAICSNYLDTLPISISNLNRLTSLNISCNEITSLPDNLGSLSSLRWMNLYDNRLIDLSPLQCFPLDRELQVDFIKESLPRRYWIKLADWQPQWLLDESDYRVRRRIIEEVGFDRIYHELNFKPLNLDDLKIDKNYQEYEADSEDLYTDILNDVEPYLSYHNRGLEEEAEILRLEAERIKLGEEVEIYYDYYPMEIYEDEKEDRRKEIFYKSKIVDAYTIASNYLSLKHGNISSLPANIGNLNLATLELSDNHLAALPSTFSELSKLEHLDISQNKFQHVPTIIDNISSLKSLNLSNNQISVLPQSIANLSRLEFLNLTNNPIEDLSPLKNLSDKLEVRIFDVALPHRYWRKFSEWEPQWLLDEDNIEIRRRLIQQLGYERICQELKVEELDKWREYTLLKIDRLERIYNWREEMLNREPMLLLKMTCPSTGHIHILRVPPEMVSAEAAITWVNHGIHPDEIAVQT